MRRVMQRVIGAAAGVVAIGAIGFLLVPGAVGEPKADAKYLGVKKCKNCHEAKNKGSQYTVWAGSKHAEAYALLATDRAKELGKTRGVDDPQHSEKCLKCHTTGYGLDAKLFARGFKMEDGIQCEACHGPGSRHMTARMMAAGDEDADDPDARAEIGAGEIDQHPGPETCLKCHNEESPGFKPFCFKQRYEMIQHLDPRKERTPEELAARKCKCGEGCKCKAAECGGFEQKK